jgi:hypothetical protein
MLTIIVYQSSGEVCTYVQEDTEIAAQILDRLTPAKLFHEVRVLIGSPLGLGIYSGHRICRLDLLADQTLESLLPAPQPGPGATVVDSAVWDEEFRNPDAAADQGMLEGDLFTSGVQIGLLGNHNVCARMVSELSTPMERISNISRLIALPFICLRLPPHGVTLLNPEAIARITLQPAFSTLPQDTWLATRIG